MGVVFNIQRFSVHDGPGIRTTVFLKGCPLRCLWCHNPESARPCPELGYHKNRCTLCGHCLTLCPSGALTRGPDRIERDSAQCRSCFACAKGCPSGAWEVYGKEMTPSEVADVALRDRRYYEKSGGGVTFSGGEPLSQAEFVRQTAEILHKAGISTAMETSLYGDPAALEELAPSIDYFMADLKAMDDDIHRRAMGVSNERILQNFCLLSRLGAEALVRVPVVPGVNDTVENIEAMARFLLENTSFREVELIKMHKLASHKYKALGRPYPAQDIPLPEQETIETLKNRLQDRGFLVRG